MSTQSEMTAIAKALKAAGFDVDEVAAVLRGEPVRAQAPAAAPVQPPKPKSDFYENVIKARVGCAYGVKACGGFAPNGVGSRQHTTCPKGRAALKAARK